ncbi:hypothetical protein JWJ90_00415 [Desulfobulbus rhabdoformis]|jgi:hypothetical protein|uniref:hypothetical protein n=1 Tax=Desulfobulbus rhabdoformis TaxID=34032 RepID=UPI0019644B35|nr:hypothetical protein [Desulfobulbus rhabdoformis]MBM9612743.1 hypothetical protein [Desulfobulbus rhabdoformis]
MLRNNGWIFTALCGLLLAGCVSKIPQTTQLSSPESVQALERWSSFLQHPRPKALDADYRLRWKVLGSQGGVDAVLLLQQPAMLRFAANDPLGRALVLLVSDGRRFTLVDNRKAEAYTGNTDSALWHEYVPASIQPQDLFAYLGGLVEPEWIGRVEPFLDAQGKGYWYRFQDQQGLTHYLLLGAQTGRLQRHLLFDEEDDDLLDLDYSGQVGSPRPGEEGLQWPGLVKVSGEAVTGEVELSLEKLYGFSVRGTSAFRLSLPPHYSVKEVE